jgi:hypothetical protein
MYSVLVWLNNLICGGGRCGVLVRTVSPCAGCLLALARRKLLIPDCTRSAQCRSYNNDKDMVTRQRVPFNWRCTDATCELDHRLNVKQNVRVILGAGCMTEEQ